MNNDDKALTCSGCGEYVGSHISDRIEALSAENKRLVDNLHDVAKLIDQERAYAQKLEAENERLRVALRFYAAWGVFAPFHDDAVREDGGDFARRTLGETK